MLIPADIIEKFQYAVIYIYNIYIYACLYVCDMITIFSLIYNDFDINRLKDNRNNPVLFSK